MKIIKIGNGIFICHFLIFSFLFSSLTVMADPESLNPGQALFHQALELKNNGRLLEAEKKMKDALELEPVNPDYHFELANVYAARFDALRQTRAQDKAKEMLDAACDQLSQTVMMKPDYLAAHYNLGVLYKWSRRFEEAREEFKKVLALDPNSVNAAMQIGEIYEEQGFFDEAGDWYRKAKQMNYGNPDIDAALEDLKEHESRAHQQMLSETRPGLIGSQMGTSAQQQILSQSGIGNPPQQGIQQAIPYLGSMLMQEFMKRRAKSDE